MRAATARGWWLDRGGGRFFDVLRAVCCVLSVVCHVLCVKCFVLYVMCYVVCAMCCVLATHKTQHNTTQHNTTQHNTTQHNTAQHSTAQHNTPQHNTPLIIKVRKYSALRTHTGEQRRPNAVWRTRIGALLPVKNQRGKSAAIWHTSQEKRRENRENVGKLGKTGWGIYFLHVRSYDHAGRIIFAINGSVLPVKPKIHRYVFHQPGGGGGGATCKFPTRGVVWPNYPVFRSMSKILVKTCFAQFTHVVYSPC